MLESSLSSTRVLLDRVFGNRRSSSSSPRFIRGHRSSSSSASTSTSSLSSWSSWLTPTTTGERHTAKTRQKEAHHAGRDEAVLISARTTAAYEQLASVGAEQLTPSTTPTPPTITIETRLPTATTSQRSQQPPSQPPPQYTYKARIPQGSWDSHMHVLDPRFPLSPAAVYTPSPTAPTTVAHARTFEADVAGLDGGVVLVQPSVYGYDNRCLLDALRALGGPERARGVVAFRDPALWLGGGGGDDDDDDDDVGDGDDDGTKMNMRILRGWHDLGVRGVRINVQSLSSSASSASSSPTSSSPSSSSSSRDSKGGTTTPAAQKPAFCPEDFQALVRRYMDAVRPLGGWVVQVYVPMDMVHVLEPVVASTTANADGDDVKLCIDHMGHPHLSQLPEYLATRDPYAIPGFDALVRLLRTSKVWVKLSAAYRFSTETMTRATHTTKDLAAAGVATGPVQTQAQAESRDVWPIARELLRVAGHDRVVFATDWPHTRFDGLDIRPWMQSVVDLCDRDETLVERVFRGNAEELWDVRRP